MKIIAALRYILYVEHTPHLHNHHHPVGHTPHIIYRWPGDIYYYSLVYLQVSYPRVQQTHYHLIEVTSVGTWESMQLPSMKTCVQTLCIIRDRHGYARLQITPQQDQACLSWHGTIYTLSSYILTTPICQGEGGKVGLLTLHTGCFSGMYKFCIYGPGIPFSYT